MLQTMNTLRTALLVAFHYPPCAVSSGLQRTLSFSMHLARHGWRPIVLTASPGAYERTSTSQLVDIPADTLVARAFALDTARHLSIKGWYWSRLAIPDRWRSWSFSAVSRGLQLIRDERVDLIWSTYPIATAHTIGAALAERSGLPWVADFRDPMVEYFPETGETFPKDPKMRAARLAIEAKVAHGASASVFCTNTARGIFGERYASHVRSEQLHVIPNGYEERAFADAEKLPRSAPPTPRTSSMKQRILLHSGVVYPGADRDPSALFAAIRRLADRGQLTPDNFELRLRDPSNVAYFEKLASDKGIAQFVSIVPSLAYREALAEMLQVDGLLLLQGITSNPAIPAKLYEYLRARRPIIALVHPAGESAGTLRKLAIDTTAPLDEVDAIAALLDRWLTDPHAVERALPSMQAVTEYSREAQTGHLASVFDAVHASHSAASRVPASTTAT
jgi:hypothetical protein